MNRMSMAAAAVVALALTDVSFATDLAPQGGRGGLSYYRSCEVGAYVVGLRARTGDWVDSIQVVCARWENGRLGAPHGIDPPLGTSKGGQPNDVFCPNGSAIVSMEPAFTRADGTTGFLDETSLQCAPITADRATAATSELKLRSSGTHEGGLGTDGFSLQADRQQCPAEELAVGFHGTSGQFIDSIGLVCAAAPEPIHSPLGRADVGDPRFGARNRIAKADANHLDPATVAQSSIGDTHAGDARAATQFGMVVPRPAAPPPAAADRFAPPTFPDGARLWACTNAGDAACDGRAESIAFCAARGLNGPTQSGLPRMMVRDRGVVVKSMKGAPCMARSCAVIDELTCSH